MAAAPLVPLARRVKDSRLDDEDTGPEEAEVEPGFVILKYTCIFQISKLSTFSPKISNKFIFSLYTYIFFALTAVRVKICPASAA